MRVCKVEGCKGKIKGLGYCAKHYSRFKRHSDPLIVKTYPKYCKITECKNVVLALGYCEKHYRALKVHGDPLYVHPSKDRPELCTVNGCNNKHYGLGYCNKHYTRFIRHGDYVYHGSTTKPTKHGMSKTSEYGIWQNMKKRCYNKNSSRYHRYGGRGVTVCEEWLHSFPTFYADMGKRPTPNHQIDRTDNDGNYEPDNCKWVTPKENANNRSGRKLNFLLAEEIRKKYATGDFTMTKLSIIYNVAITTISYIINNKQWAAQ